MILQIDVGESQNRAGLDDPKATGDERVTGHDDFIARLHLECIKRQVQSGRAAIHVSRLMARVSTYPRL